MNVFQRSFQIAKYSFNAIKNDKKMFLYPLISGLFSGIVYLLLLFISILYALENVEATNELWVLIENAVKIVSYLVAAVIVTFFKVCVSYTAKEKFEGRTLSFSGMMRFAYSKIHLIILWAVFASTIGIVLKIIKGIIEGVKFVIVKLVASAAQRITRLAWNIIIVFVVPGIVYYDLMPISAIKKSTEVLKKTWGESIVKYIGIKFAKKVVYVSIIGLSIICLILGVIYKLSDPIMTAIVGICFAVFAFAVLLFSCADQVYNTALFVYADKGHAPEGWNEEILASAIRSTEIKNVQL